LTKLVPVERNTPSTGVLPVSVITETTKYFNRQHNKDDFSLKNTGLMIDSSNNSNKNKKILNKIKNKVQKKGQEEQDFE
jgi:hypothetical protein